jgi:dihydropteroate synthase
VNGGDRDATVDRWIPRRDPARRTRVLGILNLTPDSFYDGGRFVEAPQGLQHARAMMAEGADAIDVGGESTRPGASPVSVNEELRRVLPVLEELSGEGIPVSIDTTKAEVARRAIAAGSTIVNDVSALTHDPAMAGVCAEAGCGVVLMHSRGTPATLRFARYDDVVAESIAELAAALEGAVAAGVREANVFLDPGIGFAKRPEHNLEILRRLPEYFQLGRPILLGISRKSFLSRYGGAASEDRLPATLALAALAVRAGVGVLRVHDVAEHCRAIGAVEALTEPTHLPEDSTC